MSTLSQFGGGARTPKVIVNKYSAGGVTAQASEINSSSAVALVSGALTANTLKTILSITGAGSLNFLSLVTVDTTSRTVRLKLTLDGVVAFNATSAAITVAGNGLLAVGSGTSTSQGPYAVEATHFNVSCLVEIASSLTETDKVTTYYTYRTY